MNTIVLATPHARNDSLIQKLQQNLYEFQVIRLTKPDELSLEFLDKINPTWVFFPHWSWIIPEEVFKKFRCVIFHMTDLPYGRGGSPLQNLIIRGHTETKLSAIQCVKELDAGAIYLKRSLDLSGSAEEILSRASSLMEDMIVEIVKTKPTPQEQSGTVVEFKRRQPKDSNISGQNDLKAIYNHIRMLDADGYPPAFIECNEITYEFHSAVDYGQWIEAKVRIKKRAQE